MYPGFAKLGGKATHRQTLTSKATPSFHLGKKSRPIRRRRAGPF